MQRLQLKVEEKKMERFGDTWRFQLRGNGLLFEQMCHNMELNQKKIDEINENFRNSLRFVKHVGGWPTRDAEKQPDFILKMQQMMDKLTSTDTGLGIRVRDDPVKEFIPFAL